MKKILVPIDFTELSDQVLEQAALFGRKTDATLVLLHVSDKANDMELLKSRLAFKAIATKDRFGIKCEGLVRTGSIFRDIQAEVEENDYDLMVIGTHGIHGLKQKFLGADILKIITKIPVPVLVVQSTSSIKSTYDKIVMPVASHNSYENILHAVVNVAKLFNAEVHIYSIDRPGFEWPEQLKKNLEKTKSAFDSNGIKYLRINEKQTVLSIGFAAQTLKYAQKSGAELIAMMSVSSDEYHYFAQQDKENMITNEGGIPVLCASNLIKE